MYFLLLCVYLCEMEDYGPRAQKVIRAPSLKRGKIEERITDRVSIFSFDFLGE